MGQSVSASEGCNTIVVAFSALYETPETFWTLIYIWGDDVHDVGVVGFSTFGPLGFSEPFEPCPIRLIF